MLELLPVQGVFYFELFSLHTEFKQSFEIPIILLFFGASHKFPTCFIYIQCQATMFTIQY